MLNIPKLTVIASKPFTIPLVIKNLIVITTQQAIIERAVRNKHVSIRYSSMSFMNYTYFIFFQNDTHPNVLYLDSHKRKSFPYYIRSNNFSVATFTLAFPV